MRFVCNNHIAKQSSQEDDIVKAFDLTGIYDDEDKAKVAIKEFLKTLSFNNGVVEVSTNIKPLYRIRPAIHNPETLDYLQKLFDEVTWMDRDRKLKSILGESVRFKVLRFGKF